MPKNQFPSTNQAASSLDLSPTKGCTVCWQISESLAF